MSESALPIPAARETRRFDPRAVPAGRRLVAVALSTMAACAIGLSVSPLGQVGLSLSLALQSQPLDRPLGLALPALVVGLVAGAQLAATGRTVAAWTMVATSTAAVASVSAGERLATGNTRWMSVYPGVGREWVVVAVAAAMGVTAGALIVAARRSGTAVPVAVAFAIGLAARSGNAWFQARYDVVAALLAVAATVAVVIAQVPETTPSPGIASNPDAAPTGPEPDPDAELTATGPGSDLAPTAAGVDAAPTVVRRDRAGWVALGASAVGYVIFTVIVRMTWEIIWWAGSNNPDWVGVERVLVIEGVAVGGVVAVLAAWARRLGLGVARHVLTAAALAVGLVIMSNGGGWLLQRRVLAVLTVAAVAAWLVPATWRSRPLLPVVQATGLLLVGWGTMLALRAPLGEFPAGRAQSLITVGVMVALVATVRDIHSGARSVGAGSVGAGSVGIGARLGAITLLVMTVCGAAGQVQGAMVFRMPLDQVVGPPPPPLPATYLPLCWVLLLGPVVATLLATLSGIRFGGRTPAVAD